MICCSIINKSQLEGARRLDAEYYQPEYLQIDKLLSSSPTLLSLCTKITDFGAYSQMNFVKYSDSGVRFLRNQDIGEVFIENTEPIFIPLETYKKLSLKLEECDLVTPRVGTLGNAAVVQSNHLPASANQNLAQIKPNLGKIDPNYLAVFLSSRFGRKQFERLATGNVQPWLNLSQINSLKVFIPSIQQQHNIRQIVFRSLENMELSKQVYLDAENLLLEELGLKDFQQTEGLSFVVNLSDIQSARRADAEFFQPKYQRLVEQISRHKGIKLGNLVTMQKGVEPGSEAYQEKGKLFIRVSSLSKNGIEEKDQKYLSEELYHKLKNDYEPKVGEIVLTKDASPGTAYVLKEQIDGIISGGILRLKTKADINAEYLVLCINSIIGQMQAERDAGGSIIIHWKPEQIRNVMIPVLSKPTQNKIADLVRQSHDARQKSKTLLEQAKRAVEEMIDNMAMAREHLN